MASIIRTIRNILMAGKKQQHAVTADVAVQCDLPALKDQPSHKAVPAGTVPRAAATARATAMIDITPRSPPPQAHPWPDNTVPTKGPSPLARRLAREQAIERGERTSALTWEEQWL